MAESQFKVSAPMLGAARRVTLLLMDCDGVLTDGKIYFSAVGEVMKVFHVRDGQGIASWHAAGFTSGIISGRGAVDILESRARELGMSHVVSSSKDKAEDLQRIVASAGVPLQEVAYIGDDIGDLPALKMVGFPVAVGDAVEDVKALSIYQTSCKGGHGAVREVTDLLLASKVDG